MNEFDAMEKIILQWQKVERKSRQCQVLYDTLGDTLLYIVKYAKKNNVQLPNYEALDRMVQRLHERIEIFNASDESIQSRRSDGELTEPKSTMLL